MTKDKVIALLERVSAAQIAQQPLKGRELVEATLALAYAIACLHEAVTDRVFTFISAELRADAGLL